MKITSNRMKTKLKRSMTMQGFRGKRFRSGIAPRRGPGRRHKK